MNVLARLLLGVVCLAVTTACTGPPAPSDTAAPTAELPVCAAPSAGATVPSEGAHFGVNLDWGARTLADYAAALGRRPAVAVSFASVPFGDKEREYVLAAGEQVRANGGSLLLTLEPKQGLSAVTDEVARAVSGTIAQINATGVAVIVRFAHEMNGSWYPWGQQPSAYIAAYRRVAAAVHRDAPGAAMMWAPNNADGYPFTGGRYTAEPGTPDWELIDVDGDGSLTPADDPYAPYYPGDDVVDWVGMSLYHWGSVYPWGENEVPANGKFAALLTGADVGADEDRSPAPDFYQTYSVERGKPLAIPETAALTLRRGDPAGELAVKRAWWRQVLSTETHQRFPNLKMINWFEWDKEEAEVNARVDWTVTADAATRADFVADLPAWLGFAPDPTACLAPGSA